MSVSIECLTCWYSCRVDKIDDCPLIQIQKDKTKILWLKRTLCWIKGHEWHELYDPEDKYYNKKMCRRCFKFSLKGSKYREQISNLAIYLLPAMVV